ncbi:hypothetical protein [Paenibacillus sp. URB8-2]|uniref:hypothetical protein n=1 Tax=Paenibacillus sp. URB8-2 TaxID=2741301 RepID=UPI0015B8E5A1|nr:hypothetical protein [Paenibacillus sp. URB8-2]BCG58823.1 hypothetical protein PUR_22480 [Paenibacillus sp. URB8-2]
MTRITINKASIEDAKNISEIIRISFKKQAELINISEAEYPNYVAFETEENTKSRINNTEFTLRSADADPRSVRGIFGEV